MSPGAAGAASVSALALLVARVGLADHHHVAVAADDLAFLTHSFDTRSNLHRAYSLPLLIPIGDSTPLEVIRGELHLDAIPGQDTDVVHPHFA